MHFTLLPYSSRVSQFYHPQPPFFRKAWFLPDLFWSLLVNCITLICEPQTLLHRYRMKKNPEIMEGCGGLIYKIKTCISKAGFTKKWWVRITLYIITNIWGPFPFKFTIFSISFYNGYFRPIHKYRVKNKGFYTLKIKLNINIQNTIYLF